MGSQLMTCGDNTTLVVPDYHISRRAQFMQFFKAPSPYVDLHNLFPNLPAIQFLRSLQEERFIILQSQFEGPAQQIKALVDEFMDKRSNYNHPNLFTIHRIFVEEYTKWIFPYLRVYLYFDYPQQSLAENQKVIQRKGFNQREIWTVLDCVVSALAFLQGKAGYSGNIGLNQIFQVMTPQGKTLYKVIDRCFKAVPQPVYTQFFQNLGNTAKLQNFSNQIFLSPIQVESLGKGEKYPDQNVFKSDVFSLGITCLYCIDMLAVQDLYDFDAFSVRHDLLLQRLHNLRSRQISLDLITLLKWMLELDEERRPDFIELNKQVDSLSHVLGWERFASSCQEKDYIFQMTGPFEGIASPELLFHPQDSVEANSPKMSRGDQQQQQPYDDVFDRSHKRNLPDDPIIKAVNDDLLQSRMKATLNEKVEREPVVVGGTITYSNGCYYVGEIVNGQRHGSGIFFDKSGRVLVEGTFCKDQMHGVMHVLNYPEVEPTGAYGHFDLSHGKHPWVEFNGTMNTGQRDGLGVLVFHNGDRFTGKFSGDHANGQGRYEYAEPQHVIEGRWEHDKFVEYIK